MHLQVQPYGPNAGDAALKAARKGPLELREVHFSYPLRQNAPGSTATCDLRSPFQCKM